MHPDSQIHISIHSTHKLGEIDVSLPENIFENDETELSDIAKFELPKSKKLLKLKYYVIVLNKKLFKERKKNNSLFKPYADNSSEFFSGNINRS